MEILITEDESHTLKSQKFNECYHSSFGAIQESQHIFILKGLNHLLRHNHIENVNILDVGFGTGLNAYLTAISHTQSSISYVGIEAYPITNETWEALNFTSFFKNTETLFLNLHTSEWETKHLFTNHFSFIKHAIKIEEFETKNNFDLIYFDAFSPETQPYLWTNEIFTKLFKLLNTKGILVTYCSKGSVRRALIESGFSVEKLDGPKGKRHILRATKL